VLEHDCGLDFDAARDAGFFSALPPLPAVVCIDPREPGAEPFLIRTADLRRRLERLLGPVDPSTKRLNLREFARAVRYRLTASRLEQSLAYYQHAKRLFPRRYKDLARLRPPALLKVNLRNAYPRCYVTRRIRVDESSGAPAGGVYYGPFASRRAADAFAEKFLDLFKVRRCQIKIRRDPSFPGCIYSEMKMCLAPCFAGCSSEEYGAEVQRVVSFLGTGGGSLTAEIEKEREAASQALDFERAAALHRRLDKLADVLRGLPEIARRIEDLDAVILQRAAEERAIVVFALRAGRIADPFFLRFSDLARAPRSAEEILRAQLDAAVESRPAERPDLGDHLALVARWYYSKPRDGEIFYRRQDWPYRRILRACSRLLASRDAKA
jgi:excinuclease UvrABC nuclease subunit